MPHRGLSDLEKTVFQALREAHERTSSTPPDPVYLVHMTEAAIRVLTVGSASGRRRVPKVKRTVDPGCTPDKIRELARRIEGSFTDMPPGWVSVAKKESP